MRKKDRPSFLTVEQVALRLEVCRSTVYNMIRAGHLRAACFGVSKGMRVLESEVDRIISERMDTVYLEQEDEAPFQEVDPPFLPDRPMVEY